LKSFRNKYGAAVTNFLGCTIFIGFAAAIVFLDSAEFISVRGCISFTVMLFCIGVHLTPLAKKYHRALRSCDEKEL
jgi:hypothetical protein